MKKNQVFIPVKLGVNTLLIFIKRIALSFIVKTSPSYRLLLLLSEQAFPMATLEYHKYHFFLIRHPF